MSVERPYDLRRSLDLVGSIECGSGTPEQLLETGPTVKVEVYLPPLITPKSLFALVDTGADASSIDADTARKIQLPQVDDDARVNGRRAVPAFLAFVNVEGLDTDGLPIMRFVGGKLTSEDPYQYMILGRDFLQHFDMFYQGASGRVRLAPPMRDLDD